MKSIMPVSQDWRHVPRGAATTGCIILDFRGQPGRSHPLSREESGQLPQLLGNLFYARKTKTPRVSSTRSCVNAQAGPRSRSSLTLCASVAQNVVPTASLLTRTGYPVRRWRACLGIRFALGGLTMLGWSGERRRSRPALIGPLCWRQASHEHIRFTFRRSYVEGL